MLLEFLFPQLPSSLSETLVFIVACLGGILLSYAVFVEKERRQDLIIMLGAGCLFVYALYIKNVIFSIAMGGFFLCSLIEFVEILVGLHKHHPEELKKYKAMK